MKFTDSQVPLQGTTFSYPELFCLSVRSQNCFLVFLLSITQWGSWADARTDWETFTEWFQLELIQALGQIIRVHQDTLSHTETDINDISYAPIATWQHFQSWTPLQESFDMLFATDSKPFLDSNNEIRSSRFLLSLCLPQVLQCKPGKLIPYVTSMPPEELDLICVSIHNICKQVTIFYKSYIIECLLWSLDKRIVTRLLLTPH